MPAPIEFNILSTNISLQSDFMSMNQQNWEDAFGQYADTIDELLDETRSVSLTLGESIELDVHFYLTVDEREVITATGSATLMITSPSTDGNPTKQELMFQAELKVEPRSPDVKATLVKQLPVE